MNLFIELKYSQPAQAIQYLICSLQGREVSLLPRKHVIHTETILFLVVPIHYETRKTQSNSPVKISAMAQK